MTPETEYREISLTQGQFAKVDAADYEWLNQYIWHAKWNHSTRSFYAIRRIHPKSNVRIRMHQMVLGIEPGTSIFPDHINRDTLDNRRENLRAATRSQNNINRRIFSNNTSGYKGVSYHKGHKKWLSYLYLEKVRYNFGEHDTKEAAIEARRAGALLHGRGEF